jgi:ParB-like chromosome segregation protein Spo0J|tara:strand:- start:245 stop:754 length:510 start_codon:yes stop_codon:yes gene_type:complete
MIQKVNINNIFSNPVNPRSINNIKFKKLVKSIKEFPEMLKLRPIVVNNEMGILGGNMRYKACQELNLKDVWIIKADNLTDEQMKQFVIKDNVGFGDWDWDILANSWDVTELKDWGLEIPKFDIDTEARDFSNTINESFRVEIELENEDEQEKLYNELTNKGYVCRLLTL